VPGRKLEIAMMIVLHDSIYTWSRMFTYTKVAVINLFFNHSTNFLLTNYSFCKSVRTSTWCMTQVIFPIIVNRQIISLIIHCITIPVGQKFAYSKLTAFK
jgi:hypothetical protein